MSLYFYDPFTEFDRLFDDAFNARLLTSGAQDQKQVSQSNSGSSQTFSFRPKMDLHENTETNTVTAKFELPGLKKEDVAIDVHNNRITISGESTVSKEHNQNGYAVRERSYGKFSRSLRLPQGTKPEDIKAGMEDGVLTVTFPKTSAVQQQQTQRIIIS